MRKNFRLLALILAGALALAGSAGAQTRRAGTNARAGAAPAQALPAGLAQLPASDAVLTVDVRRLLTAAVPRMYNKKP